IGVAQDPNTGSNVQNRINYGARLSGNINKLYRIGLLHMQTQEIEELGVPKYDYTVAAAQRRIGTNSNIRAIFVNRQQFKTDSSDFRWEGYNYNRVLGVDYNYSFLNNKITGWTFYHRQFTPQPVASPYAQGFGIIYSTQKLNLTFFQQAIGKGYDPAVGFVPRSGYKRISPSGEIRFFPDSELMINHGPTYDLAYVWDDIYGYSDHDQKVGYRVLFQNNATLEANVRNLYTYLFEEFDPTRSPEEDMAVKLPDSTSYNYTWFEFRYVSDPRKLFNLEVNGVSGQYFNGTRDGVQAKINYRIQPYGVFSVDFNYNRIRLPAPYQSDDIYLVSPRIDLTLSRSVFFTTFFQYNSQFNNVNINSRFQWRFKPVSDLFIVYTDNYFYSFDQPMQNWTPKTRSIVLKLTYWLNL
ncbi:MAG: hydrolase, partial [Cyclobacteriaceae bacterium]|nr:hydrolase [Cyclobacteriaceae bacterium]